MSIREEFSKSISEVERLLDRIRTQDPDGYEAALERLEYTAAHYPYASDRIEIGRFDRRSACLTQWGSGWVIDLGGILVWLGKAEQVAGIQDLKTLHDSPRFETLWSKEVFSRLDDICSGDYESAKKVTEALKTADPEEKEALLAKWFDQRQKSRNAVRRLLSVTCSMNQDNGAVLRCGEYKDNRALEVQRLTNTALKYLTVVKGYCIQARGWHRSSENDGYFELHDSLCSRDGEIKVPSFQEYSSTDKGFEAEWEDKNAFVKVHEVYWHPADYEQGGIGFRLALRDLVRNKKIEEDLTEDLRDKINDAIKELSKWELKL